MNSTEPSLKTALNHWQNIHIEDNHYQEHWNLSEDTAELFKKIDDVMNPIMNIIYSTLEKILPSIDDHSLPNNHLVLKNGGTANNMQIGTHSYVYIGKGSSASDVKVGDCVFLFLVGAADHKQHKVENFSRMSCLIAENEPSIKEIKEIENRKLIKFQLRLLTIIKNCQQYQEMVVRGKASPLLVTDYKSVTSTSFDKYQETIFSNLKEFNEYLEKSTLKEL